MGRRIAIVGAFGFQNTGDDAILAAWVHALRVRRPDCALTVLGGDAATIARDFGLDAVQWSDWPGTLDAAAQIDLFVVGGGGLFHDYWGMAEETLLTPRAAGPLYYLGLILLAKLADRPCAVEFVGVGPLRTEAGREHVRQILALADTLSVRDQGSLDSLRRAGVQGRDTELAGDAVFLLPSAPPAASLWRNALGTPPTGPILAVCVRNWDIGVAPDEWEGELAKALDATLAVIGGTVVFVPFQVHGGHPLTDDRSCAERIRSRMSAGDRAAILDRYVPPQEADALLGAADAVVGMRMHAVVMALRHGRPVVGLAYDPKVAGVLQEAGLGEWVVPLHEVRGDALADRIIRSVRQGDAIAAQAAQYRDSVRTRVEERMSAALRLLDQPPMESIGLPPALRRWGVRTLSELESLRAAGEELRQQMSELQTARAELQAEMVREATRAERLARALETTRAELTATVSSRSYRVGHALARIWWQRRHPLRAAREAALLAGRILRRPGARRGPAVPALPLPEADAAVPAASVSDGPGAGPSPIAGPGRVCIVTPAFFNLDGTQLHLGGAERYLVELVRVLRSMGYRPEVYQPADGDWRRYGGDVPINGLDVAGDVDRMNAVFHARIPQPDLTIYLALFLAAPRCFQPSIGISHGIYWDRWPPSEFDKPRDEAVRAALQAVDQLSHVVSVDTSTINWIRATRPDLAGKCHYIPNFVDLAHFRARADGERHGRKDVTVLFPRRLCYPRGFWLMHEIVPRLLDRFPSVRFHFVGEADTERERFAMEGLLGTHGDRVRWDVLRREAMPDAYREADITVIPTLSQEGTSLSCLEAMASGSAVVATHVGGLSDLVLNGYNGLLVSPEASAVEDAIMRLVQAPELRRVLGGRGEETAQTFGLDRWQEQWRQDLGGYVAQRPPIRVRQALRPPRIVVMENPNYVQWTRMRQRPHYIAERLAHCGFEVFWREARGRGRGSTATLHLIGPDEPLYVRRPCVYLYYPYHEPRLARYDDPLVIYDVLDEIEIYADYDAQAGHAPGARARDHHERLLDRADVVITSSRVLYRQLVGVRPDVMLVPNGVDLRRFSQANGQRREVPRDLQPIPRPRIGFHGALAEWIDAALLESVVRACPDYHFVFVGPVSNDAVKLVLTAPNAHYLGEKPPDEVPAYVAGFDVGIAPFKQDAITQAVRPLKVLEYLATGRPVVATPLAEIEEWPYVFPARDPGEFAAALARALAVRPAASRDPSLVTFLGAQDWSHTVRPLVRRLHRVLARESGRHA